VAAPAPSLAQGAAEPRPLGRELPVYEAPGDPDAPALPEARPEPTGVLTLERALREAVARSPALAAFSWELRARDAELLQARAFPNPEFGTEVEDFAGSGERRGFRGSQTTLSLAQLIELGGKRSKRTRLASLERDLSAWDYEAARLSVLTDTTKAFVATLALQERLVLAAELLQVAEESERTVRAAVRAGVTSPVETSRAAVAVQGAAITRAKLDRELAAARAILAASWGGRSVDFDRVAGDLGAISPPPAFETLAEALSENPDLARWRTELAQRKAAVASERAQRIPDLAVGVGPRYYADDSSAGMVAAFSVPLPLFNRNRGGILQAEYRLKRAANEQAAAVVAAQAQLRVAYEALAAAQAEVEALRRRALPEAEAAYAGAVQAYQTGLFRYVEVLDAQRTLFELKTEEIAALGSYHDAAADLERLTGTPLAHLSKAP
jgi:cobalt-zinc-cadmium efflux system outer membrane protein